MQPYVTSRLAMRSLREMFCCVPVQKPSVPAMYVGKLLRTVHCYKIPVLCLKLLILCPGTYQGTTAVHSSTKAHTVACGAVFTRSWCCHQCLKPNLLQKFELLASSNFCCIKSKCSRAALTLAEDCMGSIEDKFDKYLMNMNLTGELLA